MMISPDFDEILREELAALVAPLRMAAGVVGEAVAAAAAIGGLTMAAAVMMGRL